MLSEGSEAPSVRLPGYVDGDRRRIDLAEHLGDGIVVLAFYPADFNPACSMRDSDLGDLDLFTMQKDVTVFGVSPDSTYSHEAFAERYGLKVPLLSDPDGEAAAAYDVALESEIGEPLCQRAVFVVDHRGVVRYAWATADLEEQVDVDPVKRAVDDVGGDETALERYRVGREHYAAGREAFTEAMAEYEDREWLAARGGFADAEPEFAAAADHFDTAVRFAETGDFEAVADRAEEKAERLQHAADWLADSADALGGGRGKAGAEYRQDADRLLSAAEGLPEPPGPDALELTGDGIALAESVVVDPAAEEGADARRDDSGAADADLGVDDGALDAAVDAETDAADGDGGVEGDAVQGDLEMDLDAVDAADDDDAGGGGDGPSRGGAPDRAAGGDASAGGESDGGPADGTAGGEADGEVGADDEPVEELELADPTEIEDDDGDDERADWDIPGR